MSTETRAAIADEADLSSGDNEGDYAESLRRGEQTSLLAATERSRNTAFQQNGNSTADSDFDDDEQNLPNARIVVQSEQRRAKRGSAVPNPMLLQQVEKGEEEEEEEEEEQDPLASQLSAATQSSFNSYDESNEEEDAESLLTSLSDSSFSSIVTSSDYDEEEDSDFAADAGAFHAEDPSEGIADSTHRIAIGRQSTAEGTMSESHEAGTSGFQERSGNEEKKQTRGLEDTLHRVRLQGPRDASSRPLSWQRTSRAHQQDDGQRRGRRRRRRRDKNGRRRPKLAAAAGIGGELLIPVRIRRRSQSEKVAVVLFWISVAILYLSGVVLAINNAATVEKVQILPEWWSNNRTLLEQISTYCIIGTVAVLVVLLLYAAYLNYLKLNGRTNTVCQRAKFLLQVLLPANVLNISLLGGFVWTVFFVAAVLTVPFATYYLFLTHWELNVIAWLLAGVFTTLTTLISLREVVAHLVHYNSPRLQKHIIRILWMPIVYSWNCFFAMRYLADGVYLDAIRQGYEAFVVWSFQELLTEFLRNKAIRRELVRGARTHSHHGHHHHHHHHHHSTSRNSTHADGHSRSSRSASSSPQTKRERKNKAAFAATAAPMAAPPAQAQTAAAKPLSDQQASSLASKGALGFGGGGSHGSGGFGFAGPHRYTEMYRSNPVPKLLAPLPWQPHVVPCCCMRPWRMGAEFLHKCRVGVLQYVALQLVCTALSVLFEYFGVYNAGSLSFSHGYIYLAIVRNFSCCWALYCLIYFYNGTKSLLTRINPLPKFLSIKLIVFATFWQDLLILVLSFWGIINWDSLQKAIVANRNASLISAGIVGGDPCVDAWGNYLCMATAVGMDAAVDGSSDVSSTFGEDGAVGGPPSIPAGASATGFAEFASTALQDFLICFEMFLAALAHAYVFSYEEFRVEYLPSTRTRRALMKDRKHCCGRCLRGTRDIFDFNVHKDVQFLAVATFSDVAEGMRHGVFQVRRGVTKGVRRVTNASRALLHDSSFHSDSGRKAASKAPAVGGEVANTSSQNPRGNDRQHPSRSDDEDSHSLAQTGFDIEAGVDRPNRGAKANSNHTTSSQVRARRSPSTTIRVALAPRRLRSASHLSTSSSSSSTAQATNTTSAV